MRIAPFRLERFFAPYEFSAKYLLGSSDCQSMTVRELLALDPDAAARFQDHWLGYTEYEGAPELREQIATLYSAIDPAQTLVFSGAEEAIFAFMSAVLSPGDHIVVHAPGYQSLYEVARAHGCEVALWTTDDSRDWAPDLDELRGLLRPNTRAVVVNSPHNPTGYHMTADEQAALVAMLRERGILLFSDEVYRCLEYEPSQRLPAACDVYENAVSLGVMSKTYGLAGLRIGWIATRHRSAFEKMAAFKDYTTICNSAPSEFLSTVALKHRDAIVARNLGIIRRNLDLLDRFFADHVGLLQWIRPRAGSVAFPRLLADMSAERLCIDLVTERGVMLVPSTCFFHGDRHMRVGFGRANLPEALARFEGFLRDHGLV